MSKRLASRSLLIEACSTIAITVSQTSSGAAHTVQRMLRDPDFREEAVRGALETAERHVQESHHGADQCSAARDIHEAAMRLQSFRGQRL